MAYAWEEATDIPRDIKSAISKRFGLEPEPLIIIPEYKVPLKGGSRASQNDVFLLARIGEQTAAIMVEGKVNEPFGPSISDWYTPESRGKTERLEFLCETLGMPFPPPSPLRYQLFHRTASAILTAEKFKADMAIMLVQSFSQDYMWWDDFLNFAKHLNIEIERGQLKQVPHVQHIPTYIGWVTGEAKYLEK